MAFIPFRCKGYVIGKAHIQPDGTLLVTFDDTLVARSVQQSFMNGDMFSLDIDDSEALPNRLVPPGRLANDDGQ